MPRRILVVDDHDVVRQGVWLILRNRPEWQVVAEAEDGFEGKLGASGCVIKTHAARELVRAMQEILDRGTFFSSQDGSSPKPATEKSGKKNGMFRVGLPLWGMA